MITPQVVNLNSDTVMAFDGANIINNDTQEQIIIDDLSSISVNFDIWDITNDALIQVSNVTMTYHLSTDCWTVPISEFIGSLSDRTKYFANVSLPFGNMRPFKIQEFSVDNGSFEDALMRLPYEINIGLGLMIWYEVGFAGVAGHELFKASIYQGNTGTTPATDSSRITHRGPITVY